MADPYNPYTQYPTPTPGGVSYCPPGHQSDQQQYQQQASAQYGYGTEGPEAQSNYTYTAQPSPSHLTPNPYPEQGPARSYTPVGQPDYLGPVAASMSTSQGQKIPENLGYYEYPTEPRYTPMPSPHPPSVHVSEAPESGMHSSEARMDNREDADSQSERGAGSSLAGGAAGYYFGHKKNHGLLGALGGAIIGNLLEHKLEDGGRHSSHEHGHRHRHGHGGHHHHHHRHSRSRSHSRHREEEHSWF